MTRDDLTLQDLQNIAIALAFVEVKGAQQAAALVLLDSKVKQIIQAEQQAAKVDGDGNSTKSDQPGAGQPSTADDHSDASH